MSSELFKMNEHRISIRTNPCLEGGPSLRDTMMDRIQSHTLECMICYEMIGSMDRIWSCPVCYVIFHFKCLQSWIRYCVKEVKKSSNENQRTMWTCPCCQVEQELIPKTDSCLCGKPRIIRKHDMRSFHLMDHSCGSPCSKQTKYERMDLDFKYTCTHPCTMICHPGPCPECKITQVTVPCYCGLFKWNLPCFDVIKVNRSCGQKCHKKLGCNLHTCEMICHSGSCEICPRQMRVLCYCGKEERMLPCTSLTLLNQFSCDQRCLRMDGCLEHYHPCQEVCHSGPCESPCSFDPIVLKRCPCGKKDLRDISNSPRLSCISSIPTCGNICENTLPCLSNQLLHSDSLKHKCSKLCHTDPCSSPCSYQVSLSCRCGFLRETTECHKTHTIWNDTFMITGSFIINESSKSSKSSMTLLKSSTESKIHFFTTKKCDRMCQYVLACKRHLCREICCPFHRDYRDVISLQLRKQNSSSFVEKHFQCKALCLKPLSCGNHFCENVCHTGPCFPCTFYELEDKLCKCGKIIIKSPVSCGIRIPDCHHPCTKRRVCNHASNHFFHEEESCPPCSFPVNRRCHCSRKWLLRNVPCFQEKISCGALCRRLLPCGIHICKRDCHEKECLDTTNSTMKVEITLFEKSTLPEMSYCPRTTCDQICGKFLVCGHLCIMKCHSSDQCPEGICLTKIIVTCLCGRLQKEQPCWNNKDLAQNVSAAIQDVSIECDEVCRLNETHHHSRSMDKSKEFIPSYSIQLCEFANNYLRFTRHLERLLNEFLGNIHQFILVLPIMSRLRRGFTYELVLFYQLEAEGIGEEPYRCIMLKKRVESSVPFCLLSDFAQRRRIHDVSSSQLSISSTHQDNDISTVSLSHDTSHRDDNDLTLKDHSQTFSSLTESMIHQLSIQDDVSNYSQEMDLIDEDGWIRPKVRHLRKRSIR